MKRIFGIFAILISVTLLTACGGGGGGGSSSGVTKTQIFDPSVSTEAASTKIRLNFDAKEGGRDFLLKNAKVEYSVDGGSWKTIDLSNPDDLTFALEYTPPPANLRANASVAISDSFKTLRIRGYSQTKEFVPFDKTFRNIGNQLGDLTIDLHMYWTGSKRLEGQELPEHINSVILQLDGAWSLSKTPAKDWDLTQQNDLIRGSEYYRKSDGSVGIRSYKPPLNYVKFPADSLVTGGEGEKYIYMNACVNEISNHTYLSQIFPGELIDADGKPFEVYAFMHILLGDGLNKDFSGTSKPTIGIQTYKSYSGVYCYGYNEKTGLWEKQGLAKIAVSEDNVYKVYGMPMKSSTFYEYDEINSFDTYKWYCFAKPLEETAGNVAISYFMHNATNVKAKAEEFIEANKQHFKDDIYDDSGYLKTEVLNKIKEFFLSYQLFKVVGEDFVTPYELKVAGVDAYHKEHFAKYLKGAQLLEGGHVKRSSVDNNFVQSVYRTIADAEKKIDITPQPGQFFTVNLTKDDYYVWSATAVTDNYGIATIKIPAGLDAWYPETSGNFEQASGTIMKYVNKDNKDYTIYITNN